MALDFVVIGIGVIHYLIGNYINKENAKILLAGYNTMSKVEREKFDIDEYLEFFKPFFKKLGIYSVIIYFVFSLLLDETTTLLVWTITVTIPVIYLAIYSNSNSIDKYNFQSEKVQNDISVKFLIDFYDQIEGIDFQSDFGKEYAFEEIVIADLFTWKSNQLYFNIVLGGK